MEPSVWIMLLTAMIAVESPKTTAQAQAAIVREGAYGPLQIRQGCLIDVNEFCGTNYTLEDMCHESLARWVCIQYAKRYKEKSPEEVARLWNGGPKWRKAGPKKKRRLDIYWRKVSQEWEENRGRE